MRGALLALIQPACPAGIIPADAGSTPDVDKRCRLCRDHPRGCGEHACCHGRRSHSRGSSPRMRGAPNSDIQERSIGGIIPADAGSTDTYRPSHGHCKDHPRGCGEHQSTILRWLGCRGSSPWMRGAHTSSTSYPSSLGIIPADAGSTPWTGRRWPPSRDHPRGCGEHNMCSDSMNMSLGSSPRMRGAPLTKISLSPTLRIIPADAGSTCSLMAASSSARDHPRGCGEHYVSEDEW